MGLPCSACLPKWVRWQYVSLQAVLGRFCKTNLNLVFLWLLTTYIGGRRFSFQNCFFLFRLTQDQARTLETKQRGD